MKISELITELEKMKKADAAKDNLNFWKDFAEIGEDAKELLKIGKGIAKKNEKRLS